MTKARILQADQAMDCGIGKGAECCAYLVVGPDGFECVQKTELAGTLFVRAKIGRMVARRTPVGDFPECQQEGK